jgi:putative phosphoesterase
MRLAIVSDIHGNWTALQAVIQDLKSTAPDLVVNGGDLLGTPVLSAEMVDLVMGLGWPSVVGNTDEMLWKPERIQSLQARIPTMQTLWQMILDDIRGIVDAVGAARLQWLQSLPLQWTNGSVSVVHASPADAWNGPALTADDDELRRVFAPLNTDIVVYGHIHQPFVRDAGGFLVANSGSVGMPYDGDPRPSYLLIDDGQAKIRRVSYDIEREIERVAAAGYPHGEWLANSLRTGTYKPPS